MTRVILEMDYFYDINDIYNVKRITNICLYLLTSHENKIFTERFLQKFYYLKGLITYGAVSHEYHLTRS